MLPDPYVQYNNFTCAAVRCSDLQAHDYIAAPRTSCYSDSEHLVAPNYAAAVAERRCPGDKVY